MERVSNKSYENYPAATLYLEDVIELIEAFSEACAEVEITSGEYKIKGLSELEALVSKCGDEKFENLKIQGYQPYVSLELRGFGARTYISEDSVQQRGVIAKVGDVLHRRRKIRANLLVHVALIAMVALATWNALNRQYFISALAITAFLALLPLSKNVWMNGVIVVYAKRRAETRNFFYRKRDDVFLAIISAVFGAVAGYLVAKFLP